MKSGKQYFSYKIFYHLKGRDRSTQSSRQLFSIRLKVDIIRMRPS